jgi:hypothetical protein
MAFGDSATTFEESVAATTDDELTAGDECPEDHCEREVHELQHPRSAKLGTDPHKDAPETEVVCVHDGIVATR